MYSLNQACEIASKAMEKDGFLHGFTGIAETEGFWFFFGTHYNDGPEYGNTQRRVNKNTGKCEEFRVSAPGNVKMFHAATPVDIPEPYKVS